jgi:hypothetical protein
VFSETGRFWHFGVFSEAKTALPLAPTQVRGRNGKMGKAKHLALLMILIKTWGCLHKSWYRFGVFWRYAKTRLTFFGVAVSAVFA